MAVTALILAHAPARAQPASVPDDFKVNILIRTTLIALSQANETGNYTVLRDLASPAFRETNNAARLAELFADLRRRKLDFGPLVFFNPKLARPATLDDAGRLRVTGFFETRPEQVNFDLLYEPGGTDWRLFGIAVGTSEAVAASQPADGKPAEAKADPKAADAKPGSGRPAESKPVTVRAVAVDAKPKPKDEGKKP